MTLVSTKVKNQKIDQLQEDLDTMKALAAVEKNNLRNLLKA